MLTKGEKKATVILLVGFLIAVIVVIAVKVHNARVEVGIRPQSEYRENEQGVLLPVGNSIASGMDISCSEGISFGLLAQEELAAGYREEGANQSIQQYEEAQQLAAAAESEIDLVGMEYTGEGIPTSVYRRSIDTAELSDTASAMVEELGSRNYGASSVFQRLTAITPYYSSGAVDLSQSESDRYNTFYGIVGVENGERISLDKFYAEAIQTKYNEGSYYAMMIDINGDVLMEYGNPVWMLYVGDSLSAGDLGRALESGMGTADMLESGMIDLIEMEINDDVSYYNSISEKMAASVTSRAGYGMNLMRTDKQLYVARICNNTVYLEVFGKAELEKWIEYGNDYDEDYLLTVFTGIYAVPNTN